MTDTLVQIDNKYHMEIRDGKPVLVKTGNGVPIDLETEPVILFRGRDKLALPMLRYYLSLCAADGCTEYQMETMQDTIRRFDTFSIHAPTMKQPGSTRGR